MFWGVFEEIFSDARRPGTGGARMKEKPSKRWRNGRMAEWMDGGFRKSFSDEIFSVQWFKVTSSSSAAAAATTTTKSDFVIWNSGAQESNSRTKFNLETFSTGSGSKLDVRLIINRTTFAQLHTDIPSVQRRQCHFPGRRMHKSAFLLVALCVASAHSKAAGPTIFEDGWSPVHSSQVVALPKDFSESNR